MAQEPAILTPKSLFIAPLPDSVEDEGLRDSWDKMRITVMELAAQVHTDATLGHCRYPIYASAYVSNMMEGGLGMENDGTREYAWARINGTAHILTNLPQNYIAYGGAIQNSAGGAGWGIETWTFPQGGFKAGTVPTIIASLEGPTAHMEADAYLHTVHHVTPPTAANVTFRIGEWWELDSGFGGGPRRSACASNTVWINAIAIGEPP